MVFSASMARCVSTSVMCLLLTGCYDTDPMQVADIGRRDRSIALPLAPVGSENSGASSRMASAPVAAIGREQSLEQAQGGVAQERIDPAAAGSAEDVSQEQASEPRSASADGEVDMDKLFGFSGASAEKVDGNNNGRVPELAEGDVDAPVIDGVGTGNLRDLSAPRAIPAETVLAKPKPVQEEKVAYIPRLNNPMSAPERQGGMPVSERSCRQQLQRLNVVYRDIDPISDGQHCGIDYPVQLQSINGVRIQPAAKLNCAMALTFARWVRDDLVPTARVRYFSGVNTIRQLSSYSCRPMNSKRGNPWSEHARGNAIDVGKIVLNNGSEIDVRKPGFFSFRQKGLLNSVRADSCKYFNTVLGPGDPYHGDHFHFDLRSRKSGRRYCSLD